MSQGTPEVYTSSDAVPPDADQLAARGRARRGIPHHRRAAAQSERAARVRRRRGGCSSRSALFYGVHLAVLFYLLMVGARAHRHQRHLARVGERSRARVARGGIGGGGVGADVAQRRRALGGARRDRGPAHDGRRGGDDRDRHRACWDWRPRTTRSGGAAAASAPRCWRLRCSARWRCRSRRAVPASPGLAGSLATAMADARRCRSRARGSSCCCSTARRSNTSGRAPPADGSRTSRGCSRLARRWIWPRSGRPAPIRCGRRWRPACIRRRTACGRRPVYYVRGDTRPLALLPGSLLLARARASRASAPRSRTRRRSLRARPLWSILADAGITAGVVRWPLTFPAQPVHGFVLSDRFHQLLGSFLELDESAAYPSERAAGGAQRVCRRRRDARLAAVAGVRRRASASPEASAGLRDQFYSRAMRDLRAEWPVQFRRCATRGSTPSATTTCATRSRATFGGASEDERRRRLQVIDRYYGYIDSEIGAAHRRSAARAICCWSSRASAWSRRTPSSACSRGCSAIR